MQKCKVKSVKFLGKRKTYNLTMEGDQHNYAIFGEYRNNFIFSKNSHGASYSYISSRGLYLKAHYPHEFYTAILSCETLSEKIKEYKIEAKNHGIDLLKLDINKSKENFELINDQIYFGFSNVKGIGPEPAKRIAANQPYNNFEDFLIKFGTDSAVLKPLIGLRCFKDADPITLFKFSEHFKDAIKKVDGRKYRAIKGLEAFEEKFKKFCPHEKRNLSDFSGEQPFNDLEWKKYDYQEEFELDKEVEMEGGEARLVIENEEIDGMTVEREVTKYYKIIQIKKHRNVLGELRKLWSLRKKALERSNSIESVIYPKLIDFDPSEHDIDEKLVKELKSEMECEIKYYGFTWYHDLEKSADHKNNYTFESLRQAINYIGPVEVKIIKRTDMTSKKGKTYCQIEAEDILGEKQRINVWNDDISRWDKELLKGNLVRLRLNPPNGGFNTYTLESNRIDPKRPYLLRYPTKDVDHRVFVMRFPVEENKYQTPEEVLEQIKV